MNRTRTVALRDEDTRPHPGRKHGGRGKNAPRGVVRDWRLKTAGRSWWNSQVSSSTIAERQMRGPL